MSDLLRDQIHFLLLFADNATPRLQKEKLLETISKYQLLALSEVSYNTVVGSMQFSPSEKARLKRHARALRILGNKRKSIAARRRVLTVPIVELLLYITIDFIRNLLCD